MHCWLPWSGRCHKHLKRQGSVSVRTVATSTVIIKHTCYRQWRYSKQPALVRIEGLSIIRQPQLLAQSEKKKKQKTKYRMMLCDVTLTPLLRQLYHGTCIVLKQTTRLFCFPSQCISFLFVITDRKNLHLHFEYFIILYRETLYFIRRCRSSLFSSYSQYINFCSIPPSKHEDVLIYLFVPDLHLFFKTMNLFLCTSWIVITVHIFTVH